MSHHVTGREEACKERACPPAGSGGGVGKNCDGEGEDVEYSMY